MSARGGGLPDLVVSANAFVSELFRLRDDTVEWRELEGEVLVLDGATSTYLSLNRTGSVLWPALASGSTREQLLVRLTERFDVDGDTAARDLDAFLAVLDSKELLEPR